MSLDQLTGKVLDEKYRIERQLGRGGMGAVYLATHVGTDRPVAVKVIAPQFMRNDEFVERFRREAKAAGRLRHPNVVDVTDFGFARLDAERVAYLVMEYLDGCTLADVLAEEKRLPLTWVIDILEQVCSAVEEAHRQGIIHRDLKPDNIWLEPNRRGGYTVKVLDFGLAKLADPTIRAALSEAEPDGRAAALPTSAARSLTAPPASAELSEAATRIQAPPASEDEQTRIMSDDIKNDPRDTQAIRQHTQFDSPDPLEAATRIQPSNPEQDPTRMLANHTIEQLRAQDTASSDGLTRVGSILGTPSYMSPEQCRSEALDARSDVYSLGVIAYKMLSGDTPFAGDMAEVMRQHIESPPPPIRKKNQKIPKKIARHVMAALEKDPALRPQRAEGFASGLAAHAQGIGELTRRALALYIQHFPKFFRLSLLMHLPLIALSMLQIGTDILSKRGVISPAVTMIAGISIAVITFFAKLLSASVITGVTILLVTQLFLAPLRPLELRPAFARLKKRLWPVLWTGGLVLLKCFLGLVLLIIPGVIWFINYSLTGPVVIMENLKGRAALRRSTELVRRARLAVMAVLFIQLAMPIFASSLVATTTGVFLKLMRVANAPVLTGRITNFATTLFDIFFIPLISAMTALLYLKMRQIGGETLKETLDQFEADDAPRSKWQQRMRDRLSITSHPSR
jgi:serine/threonine protein kinase